MGAPLRGIHAEPWDKYVHMIAGEAYAAIVGVRPGSPTYQQFEGVTLTPTNALYITGGSEKSDQVTTCGCGHGRRAARRRRGG